MAIDNMNFRENIMVNVAKMENFVDEKGHDAWKQGKKVYFLWQKRDFQKIPVIKGIFNTKQGSKGQKGYPCPPWVCTRSRLNKIHQSCQKLWPLPVCLENVYYGGNRNLAVFTPTSCMIPWVKTHSFHAANRHIDYQLLYIFNLLWLKENNHC